jgi:hypothetical protein
MYQPSDLRSQDFSNSCKEKKHHVYWGQGLSCHFNDFPLTDIYVENVRVWESHIIDMWWCRTVCNVADNDGFLLSHSRSTFRKTVVLGNAVQASNVACHWESSAEMGNSASLSPSFSLVIYLNVCRGLCEFAKWITGLFLPALLFVCCGRLRLLSDFIVHCVMAFIRRKIFFIFVRSIPLCYYNVQVGATVLTQNVNIQGVIVINYKLFEYIFRHFGP